MFNAWNGVATIAGSGALSYLAAGHGKGEAKTDLRLSLDKSGSLVGDVRFIGGVAAGLVARWGRLNARTRGVLDATAFASLSSLASTEAIRYRLKGTGAIDEGKGGIFPRIAALESFGANPQHAYGANAAWAQR